MLKIGKWHRFEIIWLISFILIAIVITIASKDNFFGFTVFLSGVLCVVLVAKGNILNYVVGLYNCIGYGYIAFQNQLYGEFIESIFFFIPTSIIGFFMWKKHLDLDNESVIMKRLNVKWNISLFIGIIIATLVVGYGLSQINGQNTPYIDAATNVLNVSATLLMIFRYREQWTCYIATNILSVLLWFYREMAGSGDGLIMLTMWAAYLINSFYGYYNWSKGSKRKEV